MNLAVVGTGYVGLVTAACFAEMGNEVCCIDINPDIIENLRNGRIHIHEPGLDVLVKRNTEEGRLTFTTDLTDGIAQALFVFNCVGTPPRADGSCDLSYVRNVGEKIGNVLEEYKIIINKSTVPVGTADRVRAHTQSALDKRGANIEFDVVSNPEFLKEGAAIDDFMRPDRIVIGTDNPRTTELLRALYTPFNRSHERILAMDIRSAELTKYAANSILATKISFMNELSNIAERLGADIEQVRIGIGSDPRIGYQFIYPGAGYGGSCFPKDVRALERTALENGYTPELLHAVEAVNFRQKRKLVEKISLHYDNQLRGKTFALWGLAFKPNTDDMREASSRVLMEALWAQGATVRAFDPEAQPETARIYGERPELVLCESADDALEGADALIVMTEWNQFRSPDFDHIRNTLAEPIIFDGRNLYDPYFLAKQGFTYYSIGRQSVTP